MSHHDPARAPTLSPRAVTIGEETRFTGKAVALLCSALMFLSGGALAIYQRLGSIETRLAVLEQRVGDLAAQHAQRETPMPNTATASNQ